MITNPERKRDNGPAARALSLLRAGLALPFRLAGTLLKRTAQVILSLFIVILHPQFKWLVKVIARSGLVQNYIKPAFHGFIVGYYEPFFDLLATLPPFWATVSIALPLAILEPAKVVATILIAERPKSGLLLWVLLQLLSLVLIDRTWTAVRPQSRKIWIVSRLHAWGWLNYSYGKYWVTSSPFYRQIIRWKEQVQQTAQAFWARLAARRRA
ncbi:MULTISPECIES: hypothetical protein [Rhodomicrobium]|uniref:hypothetical protein n=1 Tax=Rhodomicrobium TaxID=1068 RepID=UPI000F749E5D|nr:MULTISPECIES: hypothetical protein [Rhodomicrobium]